MPAIDPGVYDAPADADGTTAALRAAVEIADQRQVARARRLGVAGLNADLDDAALPAACAASSQTLAIVEQVLRVHHASGRTRVRLLRVARTIADLRDADRVEPADVLEAASLRRLA